MPVPTPTQKAEPRLSAKERVYNTLRDWIIDGTLVAGEKISDVEIAAYFSVSRTPVREAIQQLAAQKLVEVFPGKESRVTQPDLSAMRQTYIMLAELQGLAVQFAFEKITGETLGTLAQINARLAEAWQAQDLRAVQRCDQEFHDVFLELAGNNFLTSFCRTLYIHAQRTETMYFALSDPQIDPSEEHARILQALRDHDQARAVTEMRRNWTHTIDLLETAAE